jgi:CRISPR/Cas system-associated endoribonuclease Cas2
VQLSVFECKLTSQRAAAELRARLRSLIDPAED